jgi:ABC-type lipoprotein export system ATPase subunit
VTGGIRRVVGESGCGKSTLAQVLMRLEPPTSGSAKFQGRDMFAMKGAELRKLRRSIQIVLQDPYTSLNPRMTVGDIVGEPFEIHPEVAPKGSRAGKVRDLLDVVGLNPEHLNRYPHQFSGGQRQRIGIARALALRPDVIVCDEPVSALDVSIQAQVKAAQDAAIVAYLVDDRGADRCPDPFRLAGGSEGSPGLLEEIRKHAESCLVCQEEWDNPQHVLRSMLSVLGLGISAGLLAKVLRTMTTQKAAALTGAALAVAWFVDWPGTARREQYRSVPPLSTSALSTTDATTPTVMPPATAQPPLPGSAEPAPVPSEGPHMPEPSVSPRPPVSAHEIRVRHDVALCARIRDHQG